MRLLNTKTLELTYFVGETPEYAILSHRWEEEEILFEDVSRISLSNPDNPARSKLGFAKVAGTCALALDDGFDWVWIDSCCIDKSSSAELQESINSMFRWYQQAQVCYAYLSDVGDEISGWNEPFERSQWFTRGWTLQELLAPYNVEFYSADWSPIGTKLSRVDKVAYITGIENVALEFDWNDTENKFCAAQKLSWAAHRRVSKEEDSAYCLFGLFDVNIPLLYGEGEEKAFQRLQKAIYKESGDHTLLLFAWGSSRFDIPMLASSTRSFCRKPQCSQCRSSSWGSFSDIPYSAIIPSDGMMDLSVERLHYIRFVRQGAIIKLPLARYETTISGVGNDPRGLNITAFVAILPWCCSNDPDSLFGIVLDRVAPARYVRRRTNPVLLPMNMIEIDREIDRENLRASYIVHSNVLKLVPEFHLHARSQRTGTWIVPGKMVHFVFRSQSFKILDWHCENGRDTLIQTGIKASFPLPGFYGTHFLLTISFESTAGQDLVGNINLWYSDKKIGIYQIGVSRGQHSLVEWKAESAGKLECLMRTEVPIGRTGDRLRVVARRIPVPRHLCASMVGPEVLKSLDPGPENSRRQFEVIAGYRLDVTHVPKESQPRIPESEPFEQVTQDET